MSDTEVSVAIVGAGAAGLGCAALLREMGLPRSRLQVLERDQIGATFRRWPAEMRFITPSFPSNGFHQTDLNAVTPDSSPAVSLGQEHPTGAQYADYLQGVVDHYRIPVAQGSVVEAVYPLDQGFEVQLQDRCLRADFVIWAAGEYGRPQRPSFAPPELAQHNSELSSYAQRQGGHQIIIGAYESGLDAAWHLSRAGHDVTLLERRGEQAATFDPSRVLSPVSQQRMASLATDARVQLCSGREVTAIERENGGYRVHCQTGESWFSDERPLLCTGFEPVLGPVEDLFLYDDEGVPLLNPFDESTLVPGLFLSGPTLAFNEVILCFIYKFRGRFPICCGAIGAELELDDSPLEHYRQAGLLLDDLRCCEQQQCFC